MENIKVLSILALVDKNSLVEKVSYFRNKAKTILKKTNKYSKINSKKIKILI